MLSAAIRLTLALVSLALFPAFAFAQADWPKQPI
jgi:hypothetical protein